jgi:3-carboxy-cis,cis-muconate cycloisomerase
MALLDPLFGSVEMNEVFSDGTRLQRMLDFEAALARAEAACGLISPADAEAIASKCRASLVDADTLSAATSSTLNPAIPLVKQLTAQVERDNAEAARFVHWGATSQDVNDTGLVLQMREGLNLIEADLESLTGSLTDLARKYRSTPIAGRTLMQHAVPTTFGMKVACWLDAVNRHRERLKQTRERTLVLQFGGAVGTLSALKEKALPVAQALAGELKLELPPAPCHAHRDRMAEVAATLGLLVGTMGKIARDISLHMQTEIGEIVEPANQGRGGSSTMPHKRNPVTAGIALAAAIRLPGLVSTMLSAMIQEDERGLGNWHAEWETLPEIFRLTGGALHHMAAIIPHFEIDVARMRSNLDASHGLIYAEGVTIALANHLGKSAAHALLETASEKARASGAHLREILTQAKEVSEHLNSAELDRLFAPENYIEAAERFTDRVIAHSVSKE